MFLHDCDETNRLIKWSLSGYWIYHVVIVNEREPGKMLRVCVIVIVTHTMENRQTFWIRSSLKQTSTMHDDVIKWKHFSRYWPFVRGIHRSTVNSPHKGQWCGALMFSLICVWINSWVDSHEIGDLRRHRAHYDVSVLDDTYFVLYLVRQNKIGKCIKSCFA